MKTGVDCHGKEWEEYTEYYHPKFDISNQTFGELTALFRVKNNTASKQAAWLCSCSCGNEVVVLATYLRSGHTSSCGCMRYEKMAATHRKPLEPGQKFGRWTILYALPMRSGCKTGTDYMCECECGTRRAVSRQSLAKGSSTSCGCKRIDTCKERLTADLVGQKFGLLTVIELAERPKTAIGTGSYWKCRCDCGKEIITSQRALSVGQIHSCGCLKQSYGEYCITQILEENDITFQSEYTFPDLHGEGGGRLRYDFAVFDEDDNLIRLIEFDGPQHYEIGSGYYNSEEKIARTQKHDNLKNQYAFDHNIPIVRFPYTDIRGLTFDAIMGDKYLLHSPS